MTDTYKDLTKELKDIKKEEKGILAAYYYLEKLKKHVLSRDVRGTRVALKRLGRVERRINRIHTRATEHLERVKKDFGKISNFEDYGRLVAEFDHLSQKANVFFSQTVREFTLRLGEIPKIFDPIARGEPVDNDAWYQMEQHIAEMETSLAAWEELDKEMLKRGVNLEEKMGRVFEETKTPTLNELNIEEVMEGMGAFKQYSKKERDAIIVKYILYAMKNDPNLLKGKEIKNITFNNIVFLGEFDNVIFRDCIFNSCDFSKMHKMWKGIFYDCRIDSCLFGINSSGEFEGLNKCRFVGGEITNCDFSKCGNLMGCLFDGLNLTNTKFNFANITEITFKDSKLENIQFFQSIFRQGREKRSLGNEYNEFAKCNLNRIYFVGANIEEIKFRDCIYVGLVDFRGANIHSGRIYPKEAKEDPNIHQDGALGRLW